MVVEGDAHVLGVPGDVHHLAGVQQARVVHGQRQVGLDEPAGGDVCAGGHRLGGDGAGGHVLGKVLGYTFLVDYGVGLRV